MSPTISFSVSAPGKVILHGEHSVVYGKTALAASLDLRTTLTLCSRAASTITLGLPCVQLKLTYFIKDLRDDLISAPLDLLEGEFSLDAPHVIDFPKLLDRVKTFIKKHLGDFVLSSDQENAMASFLCLLAGMFSAVTVPLEGFSFTVATQLTIESGMGSSASLGVCLAAALLNYIRHQAYSATNISKDGLPHFSFSNSDLRTFNEQEKDMVYRWSLLSDRVMHGNPSGIDSSICTYGSVIQFRKGEGVQKLPEPRLLSILLVHTGVTRDTGKMVRGVAARREKYPSVVDSVLDALDNLAVSAARLLQQLSAMSRGDQANTSLSQLGELIDMNQSLLHTLGVSHPTLDRICTIAQSHGLHGKLTGAGGGGYAYVLLPPDIPSATLASLKTRLEQEHFTWQEVTLGGPGIQISV